MEKKFLTKIQEIVEKFNLEPHIEGGYFREDFKSELLVPHDVTRKGERSFLTTCYYLLPNGEKSVFHRLTSDEIWHFYSGGPVDLFEIDEYGAFKKTVLGPEINKGHCYKHFVKRNTWFAACPHEDSEFAFFGCTVFPGFEFADWEKGKPDYLKKLCPDAKEIIEMLT